ncbi:MAG: hypothetical protein ACJ73S_25955 [Mycobacteriales bacterium]
MGLHTGFLVATASQRVLLGELSRHAGEFAVGDTVERMTDLSGVTRSSSWSVSATAPSS